jgi:hypothetical protein
VKRVAIIGMNNPLSENPRYALWPHPVNSTGWILWQLTRVRTGATSQDYLRAFQRYNLGIRRHWDEKEARAEWKDTEYSLFQSFDRVVLLGAAVRRAANVLLPQLYVSESLVCIPYPSSLNRWYKEARNEQIVQVIMEELYTEAVTP